MTYTVVWFKRDLRVADHAPLWHAAQRGPLLCLYIVEPGLWQQADAAAQHWGFVRESLADLHGQLQRLGTALHVVHGPAVQVLAALHAQAPFARLHAHEETGNAWTYARDQQVRRWCRQSGVVWQEWATFGVRRGLQERRQWPRLWESHMASACWPEPTACQPVDWPAALQAHWPALPPAQWPQAPALGLDPWEPPLRQHGGRGEGLAILDDFLNHRAAHYRWGMSSPLSAPSACSRLSAHLAYGGLSLREVVQGTRQALAHTHAHSPHRAGLTAFISRLHWHCHFIQKLESEPELEWRNLHRGYDGLREGDWCPKRFAALSEGRTGWPMVDACVAMLRETGWLNFRMRAMLVSVASYPLWLHWPQVGHWLARQFLDYEPGIHWPQIQMQSGTTGINTTRVYNPIKQAQDHDPKGVFVRRWLPVLRQVPDAWLFEPWRMPPSVQRQCGVRVGEHWPEPPVDLTLALREAKARMHTRRREPEVRAARWAVIERHASSPAMPGSTRTAQGQEKKRRSRPPAPPPEAQLGLDF